MSEDDARQEKDRRLKALGLRPPDRHPDWVTCIHCGLPFDPVLASAAEHALCNDCLHGGD
jgi:hypothetical protein